MVSFHAGSCGGGRMGLMSQGWGWGLCGGGVGVGVGIFRTRFGVIR